jgi:hypothetical protein
MKNEGENGRVGEGETLKLRVKKEKESEVNCRKKGNEEQLLSCQNPTKILIRKAPFTGKSFF